MKAFSLIVLCAAVLCALCAQTAFGQSRSASMPSISESSSLLPSSSSSSVLPVRSSEESSEESSEGSEESSGPKRGGLYRRKRRMTDSRITIIDNNNKLVHIENQKPSASPQQLEEQSVKLAAEERRKRKEETMQAEREEQGVKKEREDRARLQRETEEKEKKFKEEGDKKAEEQKLKEKTREEETKRKEEADKKQAEQEEKARKQKEEGEKREAKEREEKEKREAQERKEREEKQKREEKERLQEQHRKKYGVRLESGWSNFNNGYDQAAVAFFGDYCFVSGLLSGHSGHIATLPEACRPRDGRLIFSLLKGDVQSRVDVLPDGRVYHIVAGGGSWISLNGIWFTRSRPQGLSLYGANPYYNSYREPTQANIEGLCSISGLLVVRHNHIGQVNGDCAPQDGRLIFSVNNHENVIRVDVLQGNGLFYYIIGFNHQWLSMDGIMMTRSLGNYLSLYNGWSNYGGGYRPAGWIKVGKVCSVSGLIRSSHWHNHIATLPNECRPRERIIFGCNVHVQNARVDVLENGAIYYISRQASWDWLSLDCIKFVPGEELKRQENWEGKRKH